METGDRSQPIVLQPTNVTDNGHLMLLNKLRSPDYFTAMDTPKLITPLDLQLDNNHGFWPLGRLNFVRGHALLTGPYSLTDARLMTLC